MIRGGKFASGKFTLTNPEKYAGTKTPTYRSSWEWTFMNFCDKNSNVINGKGEVIVKETNNSYIYSQDSLVVGIGLEDITIVNTKDALLVVSKKFNHLLKNVVQDLKKIGIDHFFKHIFSSANSGAHKPDPRAFEALINASNLQANEICHVGDHPLNDVKGSLECGMKPIWYKNDGAEWPYDDIDVPSFEKWQDFESVLEQSY